jgi:hypothetical protein
MPLLDVVGKAGGTDPWQIAGMGGKVGVIRKFESVSSVLKSVSHPFAEMEIS